MRSKQGHEFHQAILFGYCLAFEITVRNKKCIIIKFIFYMIYFLLFSLSKVRLENLLLAVTFPNDIVLVSQTHGNNKNGKRKTTGRII